MIYSEMFIFSVHLDDPYHFFGTSQISYTNDDFSFFFFFANLKWFHSVISKWTNLRHLDPLLILNIKDKIFILVLAEYYTSGKIFLLCACVGEG